MTSALTVALLISAIVLCAVGIWAFVRVGLASQSVQTLAEDLEERLVPLVDKADVTVDAINAELLRVDMIVTQVEDVSDRVSVGVERRVDDSERPRGSGERTRGSTAQGHDFGQEGQGTVGRPSTTAIIGGDHAYRH